MRGSRCEATKPVAAAFGCAKRRPKAPRRSFIKSECEVPSNPMDEPRLIIGSLHSITTLDEHFEGQDANIDVKKDQGQC